MDVKCLSFSTCHLNGKKHCLGSPCKSSVWTKLLDCQTEVSANMAKNKNKVEKGKENIVSLNIAPSSLR